MNQGDVDQPQVPQKITRVVSLGPNSADEDQASEPIISASQQVAAVTEVAAKSTASSP